MPLSRSGASACVSVPKAVAGPASIVLLWRWECAQIGMALMRLVGVVAALILAVLVAYYFSHPRPTYVVPTPDFNDAR